MIFTNQHGIMRLVALAIMRDEHVTTGDYSVTELISPPRMTHLKKRHAAEIVKDVSDMIWAFFGHCVHAALRRQAEKEPSRYLSESHMEIMVSGFSRKVKVSGSCDLYDILEQTLSDYKCTKVWAFMHGAKAEWEAQLNIYALMLKNKFGHIALKLQNHLICRNWEERDAHKEGYPTTAFPSMDIRVWPERGTLDYLEDRVNIHERSRMLDDNNLPDCTPEERWKNNGRCRKYCDAAQFCNQWKSLAQAEQTKAAVDLHDMTKNETGEPPARQRKPRKVES